MGDDRKDRELTGAEGAAFYADLQNQKATWTDRYIERLVAEAPPLSDEQIWKLRILMSRDAGQTTGCGKPHD